MSVVGMKPNQTGTVMRINGGYGLVRRLQTMGVRPGVSVTKKSSQLFRGPVIIRVGATEMALGFGMAQRITVEVKE